MEEFKFKKKKYKTKTTQSSSQGRKDCDLLLATKVLERMKQYVIVTTNVKHFLT